MESAQPKKPIVAFRRKDPGRTGFLGSGSFYGMRKSGFPKKIGESSSCTGHYLLSVLFVSYTSIQVISIGTWLHVPIEITCILV